MPDYEPISSREALQRLRDGNRRYASDVRSLDALLSHTRRAILAASQNPFAVILGCSDSRVPAEVVFDQGLGDLFVIRVAGNIVAPSQIGSVEFSVEAFGSPLVVVLGHSGCGAVTAALHEARRDDRQDHLGSIVERIRPVVEPLLQTDLARDELRLMHAAVRANVRASADHLRRGSALLERQIHAGRLLIVGAEYSLETGEVDFFDGVD